MKLFLFLILTSCSATMVSRPGSMSQYGPSNESSRVGTIKYLNDGASSVVSARREDAYKQMYQACNGKYKITGEGPNASGGVLAPAGNFAVFAQQEYWFINFQCD